MAIIEVNHVTKEFRLGQIQSIKLGMQRMFAWMSGHAAPARSDFKALDDVDFKVEQGEVLGIIGSNGAGKSTLLKILSRITVPTTGSIKVQGKVAPLIEVGAGLVGDLTGRENIYLNAAILGISRKELAGKFDEIVEFSELEEFLDTPVKRYSTGMAVRLGFSIATSVESDILIVDEVLAVGDLAFQRKCFDRMEDLIKRQKKTVLLVSHNIRQVERLCTRAILLDHGRVLADGDASETCNLFYERSDEKIKRNAEEMLKRMRGVETSGELDLLEVQILDEAGNPTSRVIYDSDITVVLQYKTKVELTKPTFGLGVHTTDFVYLATINTADSISIPKLAPGTYEIRCKIKRFPFLPGVYALRLGVSAGELHGPVFYAENALFFQVMQRESKRAYSMHEGFFVLQSEWSTARLEEQDPKLQTDSDSGARLQLEASAPADRDR